MFKGKRFLDELMAGATEGAAGTVSDSGWSNSVIFEHYLKNHFLKFVAQPTEAEKVLILYDGHKSHVNIGLIEWAISKHIILFVLPPHTSHVLQPLDIGCYGPFQRMYNNECHKFMRCHPGQIITRYDVCGLA